MRSAEDVEKGADGREVVRGEGGRWLVPPKSPGRPKGSSQSELVRKLIEPHREVLIERALKLTESADPFAAANALRIVLERLAPAPKQESEKIEVPGLADAATFADKCQAVIAAVASGDVSAEAGERVLRLMDVYRRAVEHDSLEQRIAALEKGRRATVIEPDETNPEDLA
jgi:hypothetical protein